MIATLLFWRYLSYVLVSCGFNPNPHDICVMNKMVNVQHCTILWPVNDNNILHVILKVVDGVLSQLTTKYKKVSSLSASQGRVNDYLGMRIDYSKEGKARITMHKRIKGILEAAAENMNNIANTTAANHLSTVQEDGSTLTRVQTDLFRNLVAKILFASCRSRPNLKMALDFVAARVRNPDKDNYKNLAQTIHYIRAT